MRVTSPRCSSNVATHDQSPVLQSCTRPPGDPVAMYFPSCRKHERKFGCGFAPPSMAPVCRPRADHVPHSQTRTDMSLDTDSKDLPSEENDTSDTVFECPRRTASGAPVEASQIRTTHVFGSHPP